MVLKLTKRAYSDKCRYSGYSAGCDVHSQFVLTRGELCKDIIIFGVENKEIWLYQYMLQIR